MDAASAIVSAASFVVSIPAAAAGVRAYRTFGGLRLVSCPETAEAVAVRIDVMRAIASRLAGRNELRLRSCSRWPERQGCDQACLAQLTASSNGCRARELPGKKRLPQLESADLKLHTGRRSATY